jgi:sugar phosphate permease
LAHVQQSDARGPSRVGAYAWYALFVFVLIYTVNFIDRQILSILAEDIKRDLKVDDAQIGFLYGTAFASSTLCSASRSGVSRTAGTAAG